MPAALNLLCAGAAQGLVKALEAPFNGQTGAILAARFGAVGAMKEALLAGAPCDLMIVTEAMVSALCDSGQLLRAGRAALGRVRTGLAVRAGAALPDVASPEALRAALLGAPAIYFPDPALATAGIHFAKVMRQLGIFEALTPRFCTFPNGATAMRELAANAEPGAIGCTQITEILYTGGIVLAGALPTQFELATAYTAALSATASLPALAAQFIELLAGTGSRDLRAAGGFEFSEPG